MYTLNRIPNMRGCTIGSPSTSSVFSLFTLYFRIKKTGYA